MPLTNERKGEIALVILKQEIRSEGLQVNNLKRKLGDMSLKTNVEVDELIRFMEELFWEIMEETFPKTNKPPTEPPQTYHPGRQH